MAKKNDPLQNILGRVEDLDASSVSNLIARLARERRMLNAVFNLLREGVLVVDADGTIVYANQSSSDLLGIRMNAATSHSLWRCVPELARSLRLGRGGLLRATANISREVELSYPEKRSIRLYIVPFEEEVAGAPIARYAIVLSDITAEKTRTRQEVEDERVRSILDLAAGVAHELGNPLNSLTIHLQLMQRQLARAAELPPHRAKLEHSLEVCAAEVARLDGIIRHFLEAVLPQQPDMSDTEVQRPLEDTIQFLGPELESADIRVDLSVESAIPNIMGDHNLLKQVFFNVIRNALQAMQAGGVIRIRLAADNEWVFIHVADTGAGIAEQDLAKVFRPYYTTKKDGSGLGMMIVERIMRAHGGSIGIDSRPGAGTVITLQLPHKNRRVRMLEEH
jgi:two-component system, sporulation sensor kinase E